MAELDQQMRSTAKRAVQVVYPARPMSGGASGDGGGGAPRATGTGDSFPPSSSPNIQRSTTPKLMPSPRCGGSGSTLATDLDAALEKLFPGEEASCSAAQPSAAAVLILAGQGRGRLPLTVLSGGGGEPERMAAETTAEVMAQARLVLAEAEGAEGLAPCDCGRCGEGRAR